MEQNHHRLNSGMSPISIIEEPNGLIIRHVSGVVIELLDGEIDELTDLLLARRRPKDKTQPGMRLHVALSLYHDVYTIQQHDRQLIALLIERTSSAPAFRIRTVACGNVVDTATCAGYDNLSMLLSEKEHGMELVTGFVWRPITHTTYTQHSDIFLPTDREIDIRLRQLEQEIYALIEKEDKHAPSD